MRLKIILICGLFILPACVPEALESMTPQTQLTAYATSTPANKPVEQATKAPQDKPTPEPTATPLVHVVGLGETISSIALRYGLDMSAVLAANPDVNPNMLIVGTEVIIPVEDSGAQLGSVSEPLKLNVGSAECFPTFEGGLWCFVPINNPLEEAAAAVTVSIKLKGADEENNRKINIPLLLEKIEPGQSIPAAAYFAPPVPESYSVSTSLVSALPINQSGRNFLSSSVVNDQVNLNGQTAEVKGEVEINGEADEKVILQVAAIGYDTEGKLAAARQSEIKLTLEPGNAQDFDIHLYSLSGAIASVQVFSTAYQNR